MGLNHAPAPLSSHARKEKSGHCSGAKARVEGVAELVAQQIEGEHHGKDVELSTLVGKPGALYQCAAPRSENAPP